MAQVQHLDDSDWHQHSPLPLHLLLSSRVDGQQERKKGREEGRKGGRKGKKRPGHQLRGLNFPAPHPGLLSWDDYSGRLCINPSATSSYALHGSPTWRPAKGGKIAQPSVGGRVERQPSPCSPPPPSLLGAGTSKPHSPLMKAITPSLWSDSAQPRWAELRSGRFYRSRAPNGATPKKISMS